MTDNNDNIIDDPWQIADQIDELIDAWDPNSPEPAIAALDEQWLNRRMLALQFKLDEIERIRAMYESQIAVLFEQIHRLSHRRDGQIESEHRSVVALTSQLDSYHRALIADAERRGVKRLPTTVRMPHGDLRSRAGGKITVQYDAEHESDIVEWLEQSGLADAVRVTEPVPAKRLPDKRRLSDLVKLSDDGDIIGIVNKHGEPLPHVEYRRPERSTWIELADGRSSKSWLDSQQ